MGRTAPSPRPAGRSARLRPLARLRRAASDSRGSATVEFALWLPILVGLILSIADMALIFTTSANMQHAARETARGLARHVITVNTAEAYVRDRLEVGDASSYRISVTDGPDVEVKITISATDASVFGVYETVLPGDIVARAVMRREDPA